jgi:hypothetical protein
MSDQPRKKSPRAPSIALDEAIERALRVYDKEKRHPAPTEVVAQDMGYKSANNGSALSVLASLRYYGLLERPEDGMLAVAKDVENYQYAPDDSIRHGLLQKWLRAPTVFDDLLAKYPGEFPSDKTLRFDLINSGFSPVAAESVIAVFRRSAEFAGHFNVKPDPVEAQIPDQLAERSDFEERKPANGPEPDTNTRNALVHSTDSLPDDSDKIPIRLSGGRRAWLVIPNPFYAADKNRLKAQIDLLLTEDQSDLTP